MTDQSATEKIPKKVKRMESDEFYRLAMRFWGEEWRDGLRKLLQANGLSFCRQTFWHWRTGERRVDPEVAGLLRAEKLRRKSVR